MRRASLRPLTFLCLTFAAGCTVGETTSTPGDDDDVSPDAASSSNTDAPTVATCGMPGSTPDLGAVTATAAQQKNQPGSQGTRKIYVAAATLPGTDETVQVELWDNLGAFAGRTVAVGTYPITAAARQRMAPRRRRTSPPGAPSRSSPSGRSANPSPSSSATSPSARSIPPIRP
jgi:hypothetical protein